MWLKTKEKEWTNLDLVKVVGLFHINARHTNSKKDEWYVDLGNLIGPYFSEKEVIEVQNKIIKLIATQRPVLTLE